MSHYTGSILVIDDESDICELVQLTLESIGFQVLVGCGGKEGLQAIKDHSEHIKLILLDLAMPGVSGIDLIGILKTDFPQIPVIVMSGYVADKSEVVGLGAVDVLRKPFQLKDVEQKVIQILLPNS